MAIVISLMHQPLERDSAHLQAECTYDIVVAADGRRYLQLDTYGSKQRQITGKKSQSILLAPEAIAELKSIIARHNL